MSENIFDATRAQIHVFSDIKNCAKHGDYTSKNFVGNVWSGCPACRDEKEKEEKIYAEKEKNRIALEAWGRRVGSAGIPERFRDRTFENFVAKNDSQKSALNIAKDFADNFEKNNGRCLIFVGRPGTGKTHLASAIGVRLIGEGRIVLFTTVLRAMRRIKDTWVRGAEESESEAVACIVEPDLLILDEVGVQFGSDFEKNTLFDILNERYEKRKSTLLMSNLAVTGVREYLGERVFDRMREDGGEVVVFSWESYRSKG